MSASEVYGTWPQFSGFSDRDTAVQAQTGIDPLVHGIVAKAKTRVVIDKGRDDVIRGHKIILDVETEEEKNILLDKLSEESLHVDPLPTVRVLGKISALGAQQEL